MSPVRREDAAAWLLSKLSSVFLFSILFKSSCFYLFVCLFVFPDKTTHRYPLQKSTKTHTHARLGCVQPQMNVSEVETQSGVGVLLSHANLFLFFFFLSLSSSQNLSEQRRRRREKRRRRSWEKKCALRRAEWRGEKKTIQRGKEQDETIKIERERMNNSGMEKEVHKAMKFI